MRLPPLHSTSTFGLVGAMMDDGDERKGKIIIEVEVEIEKMGSDPKKNSK